MRMSLLVVSLWLFLGCLTIASSSAATVEIVPGGSTVAGKPIGEWTADWWNWANSISPNIFNDTTGAQANENQSGPVFFVAGTSSGSPPVTRNFTVPQGKYVLFPLINWITANGPDAGFANTAEEVTALVDGTVDVAQLIAQVDGIDVPDLASHREQSQINFTLNVVADSTGFPAGTYTDANADGYWVMLAPLGAGESHTLHFGGTSKDFTGPQPAEGDPLSVPSFTVDVTSNITITGAAAIPLPPAVMSAIPFGAVALASFAWRRRLRAAM